MRTSVGCSRGWGVFVGGATLEAVEAICSGGTTPPAASFSILDGLASLVDKSLLRQLDDAVGESRFVMLETIREYAQECLAASDEAAVLRHLHADYLLALAEQAEPELARAAASNLAPSGSSASMTICAPR